MTLPAPIVSTIFVDGELTNEVKWYTRIFTVINQIIAAVATLLPLGVAWSATSTGTTALGVSTWTDVTLASIIVDTQGTGIGSGGYYVPTTGVYEVSGNVLIAASATAGRRGASVARNGTQIAQAQQIIFTSGAGALNIASASAIIACTVGDHLTVQGFTDVSLSSAAGCGLNVRRIA